MRRRGNNTKEDITRSTPKIADSTNKAAVLPDDCVAILLLYNRPPAHPFSLSTCRFRRLIKSINQPTRDVTPAPSRIHTSRNMMYMYMWAGLMSSMARITCAAAFRKGPTYNTTIQSINQYIQVHVCIASSLSSTG